MKQRGRRSAAELSVIGVDVEPARPSPPATLSEPERELFSSIVGGCDAEHFRQTDLPLLSRYCEAAVLAEQAALELRNGAVLNGKPSPMDGHSGKVRQGHGVPKYAAALVATIQARS
jgi:hypothetical protein